MNSRTLKILSLSALMTLGLVFTACNVEDNNVNVVVNPPTITTQPTDVTVAANSTATFTVVATGESLSYQWVRESDGTEIAGATSATLTITSTTTAMNGSKYHCKVKNSKATVTTTTVTLVVTSA
jgi:hypothetical protein